MESKEPHTGICLYASDDLTRANLIKKGNILAKDGLEVALANTLSGHLGGVDPSTHVNVRTDKHTNACKWGRGLITRDSPVVTKMGIHAPRYTRYDAFRAAT